MAITGVGAWAQSTLLNGSPTRELGHPKSTPIPTQSSPNYVEGREFYGPVSVAFDRSSNPPAVYVVDLNNNRVLGWKNSANVSKGTCADIVIGQRDMLSTTPLGFSGSSLASGLSFPTAVAVDASGNVYVADNGNHRILRYPKPFDQVSTTPCNQSGAVVADLVIGQKSISGGGSANQNDPQGIPSAKTLNLSTFVGLAFDSKGNLWTTDPGNRRVLRYPVAGLVANNPAADLVVGQITFDANNNSGTLIGSKTRDDLQSLFTPQAIAFGSDGTFYILDDGARVLVYPAASLPVGGFAKDASRVLGLPPADSKAPYPNTYSLGMPVSGGGLAIPRCLFTSGDQLFVCDTGANRIVQYDSPGKWAVATAIAPSPVFLNAYPPSNLNDSKANNGQNQAQAGYFNGPRGGAIFGAEMWVVDSGNNRVMALTQGSNYTQASKVLGQLDFGYSSPNLVEGRELFFGGQSVNGTSYQLAGVVVDKSSNPPHLYIADSANHRILCFNDVRNINQNTKADFVIGQPDLFSTVVNYPNADVLRPSAIGLNTPAGLALDANGNLWVADSGNGRVLRYFSPFRQAASARPLAADRILGQITVNAERDTSIDERHLGVPVGVAVFSEGSLAVSDLLSNRVLIFQSNSGDFNNFQAAKSVLGQPDFFTASTDSTQPKTKMRAPFGVAVDTSDRLYVADSGDGRLMIFENARNLVSGSASTLTVGVSGFSVAVSTGTTAQPGTGEIIAADANGVIWKFPEFSSLPATAGTSNARQNLGISGIAVPALALDANDNLIVAEGVHRVSFYYPKMVFRNGANYNAEGIAPGMYTLVGRLGKAFDTPVAKAEGSQLPTTMSDIKVLFNGIASPIWSMGGGRIDFVAPMKAICPAPPATAELQVIRASTNEVLGVLPNIAVLAANPGLFTLNLLGTGQIAARNDDGVTANGPDAPVARTKFVSMFLTGQGCVDNAPDDGVAPTTVIPTKPVTVLSAGCPSAVCNDVPAALSGFPGVFQINYTVPEATLPSTVSPTNLVVRIQGQASSLGGTSNADGSAGPSKTIQTNITVK
jgi:uncharacterized protein (TIGR03437 family)